MPDKTIQILLVEDNADEAVVIRERLLSDKNQTFDIVQVNRLDRALARLAAGGFDLVMLDLILPDSRGLDTFTRMNNQFPDVPILVLTCMGDDRLAARVVQEGAQDYLVKGQGDGAVLHHAVRYAIERHRVRQASQEALRRQRELSETKSRFVAEVSHEIRTPLAIIREFVALVQDETVGPLNTKQKDCLVAALRNCDKLTGLIGQILDLAKIESGKTDLHPIRADLAALLMQVGNDFLPMCRSKQQTLALEIPEQLPAAHCDVASIQNVLTNLIGNAHKFTPPGGTIRVRIGAEGVFLRVDVEDTGPGIPPEALDRIFEAFVQIDRQNGPGANGTGLGLKIVKSLVELNGGVVSVTSTVGKGSCFSFTVPSYDRTAANRILIVDDEEGVILLIKKILQYSDLKLEVKATQSGLDALIIAGQFKPNLVILDLNLAEVAGEKVLQALKQQDSNAAKVLMISGSVSALTDRKLAIADDYLVKPFSADKLMSKIRNLLPVETKQYLEPTAETEAAPPVPGAKKG